MGLGYYWTIILIVSVWDDRFRITLDIVSLGLLWRTVLRAGDALVIGRVGVILGVEVDHGGSYGGRVYCNDNYCMMTGVCVVLVTGSTVT